MSLAVLVAKDLRVEWRGRDILAATGTVALLVALAGNIAYSDTTDPAAAVAGVTWTAIVFATQVGLARTFVIERERGTYTGLLTSPASSLAVYTAKVLVHLLVAALVGTVTLVATLAFFRTGLDGPLLAHLAVLATGLVGLVLATTLTAAIALHGRNWILLVPLLTLPLLFPVLAAAIPATSTLQAGAPVAAVYSHLRVLVAFDVIFAVAAWILVPFVLEP